MRPTPGKQDRSRASSAHHRRRNLRGDDAAKDIDVVGRAQVLDR